VQTCGRSENRTFAVIILFFFYRNKTHLALRNELQYDKVAIVGKSKNGPQR